MTWPPLTHQDVLDEITALEAAYPPSTSWQTWTPTLGGTGWAIGNGTRTCRYRQLGKTVHFVANIAFGSTSTFGASAPPTLTLPVAGFSGPLSYVPALYFDLSASLGYPGFVSIDVVAGILFFQTHASPVANLSATVPFTWANGDLIRVSGTYEAA